MKEITLPSGSIFKYYTPKELKEHLDEYVIGQEEAKRVIATAMYNHEKRILMLYTDPDTKIDKSNVLIAGPTGCGKTYMIKCLAEFLGYPYYIADCNTYSAAGYVGDDITSALAGLLRAAGWSTLMAETGIVILDEVDKIAKKGENPTITRDVGGECVQQGFLKMIEGDRVGVPPQGGRKHPEQPLVYINTKNILFVGMGAFVELENIIKNRMNVNRIGYSMNGNNIDTKSDEFNAYEYMSQEDLIKFGLIPEFVGRFPVLTNVNALRKEDMLRILTEPKNSIVSQYKKLFEIDNIHIEFGKGALEFAVDVAYKMKTGARGLKSMMEVILNDFIYDLSDGCDEKTVIITKKMVEEKISKRYGTYLKEIKSEKIKHAA